MSPLSYGVVPFAVDRAARTQPLTIAAARPSPSRARRSPPTSTPTARPAWCCSRSMRASCRWRAIVSAHPLDHFFTQQDAPGRHRADPRTWCCRSSAGWRRLTAPGGDGERRSGQEPQPVQAQGREAGGLVVGDHRCRWPQAVHLHAARSFQRAACAWSRWRSRRTASASPKPRAGSRRFRADADRADARRAGRRVRAAGGCGQYHRRSEGYRRCDGDREAADHADSGRAVPAQSLSLQPGREGTRPLPATRRRCAGRGAVVVVAQSGKFRAQRRIEVSVRPAVTARQDLRVGHARITRWN